MQDQGFSTEEVAQLRISVQSSHSANKSWGGKFEAPSTVDLCSGSQRAVLPAQPGALVLVSPHPAARLLALALRCNSCSSGGVKARSGCFCAFPMGVSSLQERRAFMPCSR